MSHASMLKARRQHQRTKKRLHVEAKQAKRLAKQALAGPVVKKEKVKKERVKPERVKTEKVEKVKLTKEPGIRSAYCVESRRAACVKPRTMRCRLCVLLDEAC